MDTGLYRILRDSYLPSFDLMGYRRSGAHSASLAPVGRWWLRRRRGSLVQRHLGADPSWTRLGWTSVPRPRPATDLSHWVSRPAGIRIFCITAPERNGGGRLDRSGLPVCHPDLL